MIADRRCASSNCLVVAASFPTQICGDLPKRHPHLEGVEDWNSYLVVI